jgi:hypothetical protein
MLGPVETTAALGSRFNALKIQWRQIRRLMIGNATVQFSRCHRGKLSDRVANRSYAAFCSTSMSRLRNLDWPETTGDDNKAKPTLWDAVFHGVNATDAVEISELGQPVDERSKRRTVSSLHTSNVFDENEFGLEILDEPKEVEKQRPPVIVLIRAARVLLREGLAWRAPCEQHWRARFVRYKSGEVARRQILDVGQHEGGLWEIALKRCGRVWIAIDSDNDLKASPLESGTGTAAAAEEVEDLDQQVALSNVDSSRPTSCRRCLSQ